MPNGLVESFHEESHTIWSISLNTGAAAKHFKRKHTRQLSRTTSVTIHNFDIEGRETVHMTFRPRNPDMATIEFNADGSGPVVISDSIDMAHPTERTVFKYTADNLVAVEHWESTLGTDSLVLTDTLQFEDQLLHAGSRYMRQDSTETQYFYFNDHDCVSKIETDRADGTMSVTIFDNYKYDRYGNWTSRDRYSLRPDGRHIHTGSDSRKYRYR